MSNAWLVPQKGVEVIEIIRCQYLWARARQFVQESSGLSDLAGAASLPEMALPEMWFTG
jgi:hypothetical protein